MSDALTCPRCNQPLAVREPTADPWLTCPHCLASVRNPRADQVVEQPAPQPPRECRVCGEPLRPRWRACPHCGAPALPPRRTSLDRDVRQDRTGTWILLGVLAAMLAVGVIVFFVSGVGDLISASPEGAPIALVAVLALGAVAVGVGFLLVRGKDPTTKAIGASLGAVAISSIIALALVLLVVAAICAGISNFFKTCKIT